MTATTVMRDSAVGDAWIAEACRVNPAQRVVDDKGVDTGNILTGPVRLVFCDNLLKAGPKMKSDPNSKHGFATGVLFTPYTDLALFWEEYWKICASDFASHRDAQTGQYYGLENPIFDQGTKSNKYKGFTPGLMATNLSSNFAPNVVDPRGNPIAEAKVYPGVWAIVAVNAYASGKNQPKKGPRFGLASVMIIGDDTPLGGGAVDPRMAFKGVQVKPPITVPSAAFGQPGAVPSGAPGGPPVGAAAVGTFYPPGGGNPAHRPPMSPPPLGSGDDEDMSQFR